jgi:hypothetical protein
VGRDLQPGELGGVASAAVDTLAYGFAVSGCGARWLDRGASPGGLELRLAQRPPHTSPPHTRLELTGDGARALLVDGHVLEVDAARGEARLHGPALLSDDLLVHPYLGVVAGLASRLHGRDALHAGAFVVDGGAWLLFAGSMGGKSTMLAALSAAGAPILADDLAVIVGGRVQRGPRCVDLRHALPPAPGPGGGVAPAVQAMEPTPLERVRGGARLRVSLPAAPVDAPLRGFVRLRFGATLALSVLPPAERLQAIAGQRTWTAIAADPHATLAAASLAAFELEQPMRIERVTDSAALLVDRLTRCA